jgi:HEAT repeat protein
LVAGLDDEDFEVRQKATEELRKIGLQAEPALLRVIQSNPTFEVRRRVKLLLDHIAQEPPRPERLREMRALEVLEYVGTPETRKILGRLAEGVPEARLTREAKAALTRLER